MIHIKNLHKNLSGKKVLNDISLTINDGEVVAIIGPSGSGKSTLLRCMNGLEKIDSGSITINNTDISHLKTLQSLQGTTVGMVFQHFHLFPHMTVRENLIFAPKNVKGVTHDDAIHKARTVLAQVGLTEKETSYPAQLSGGQKQRVAIARALCMEPSILLLDEPTSALDPEMVKEVLEVIRALVGSTMTMVIVTHEMNFAREVASRLLFLDKGQVLEDAAPSAFFKTPQTSRAQEFLHKVL